MVKNFIKKTLSAFGLLEKTQSIYYAVRRTVLRWFNLNYKQFYIDENISFKCDLVAAHNFRHFTELNADLQAEIKAFAKYTEGKKMLLDIGAFFGIFALTFAARNKGAKVYAIEPSPKGQQLLRLNKRLNPDFDFEILPYAMGDKSGSQTMHFEWHHLVANSGNTTQGVMTEFKTIDEVVSLYSIRPDVIKIDVEGFEYKVLTGARNYLMNNAPLLFIELHADWMNKYGNDLSDLISLLKDFGYRFYNVTGGEIASPYTELNEFGYRFIGSKNPIGLFADN